MLLLLLMATVLAGSADVLAESADALIYSRLSAVDLVAFASFTSPMPGHELGMPYSRYTPRPHHTLVGKALQRVEAGTFERLEIELPPRHGKSELAVRKFVPWFAGKHPDRSVIVVTHTDSLALEHGRDVRDILRSRAYAMTFPERRCELRSESQAADRLALRGGGVITFTGRGGLGAGIGADLLLCDDFFKNTVEAESPTVRDAAWRMFFADCQSRLNTEHSPVVVIGTRRNEDDVQGRLFDPTNLHYDEREARRWRRIRLPALAEDNDPLGRKRDEPLWPEKFDVGYYEARRSHKSDIVRIDFQTQDQCRPTAQEGNWFKRTWLSTYEAKDLPAHLTHYCSSDHALTKDERNDRGCLLSVGIDATDTIWVLSDTVWDRFEPDVLVERMLGLMAARHPVCWWAARDQIRRAVGPFLRKRMLEERVYAVIQDVPEDTDLIRRSHTIRGRMAMGMVRWPRFAPWWPAAEQELLSFPNGKFDDLVAALAVLGMGLDKLVKSSGPPPADKRPKPGTLGWVKATGQAMQRQEEADKNLRGW